MCSRSPGLRSHLVLLLFLAIGGAGCAARAAPPAAPPAPEAAPRATALPAPATPPRLAPPPPACDVQLCTATQRLASELDALFAAPALQNGVWSAMIQSFDTGEVLYRLNPDTLVLPASNMKIVTMAVGARRLGWDHRYETRLEATAPVEAGVLRGDLFVVGGGDPSINQWYASPDLVLDAWAAALRAGGITAVAGRVVGDDDAFDVKPFGAGWAWDDMAAAYSAAVGALQVNESVVEVTIAPGAAVGAPARVTMAPAATDLVLVGSVSTAPAGAPSQVSASRFPGRPELEITGSIAADAQPVTRWAAVDNPTLYAARVIRDGLVARGIAIAGEAVDIDEVPDAAWLRAWPAAPAITPGTNDPPGQVVAAPALPARRVIATWQSPPLSEIGRRLMKVSQNLYAETVFHSLSARPGPATVEASRKVVEDVLGSWGIAPTEFRAADGSGLSRRNLLSASMILRLLRAVDRDPALGPAFEATLPVAGRDGTLGGRMKGTRAEGNVVAKTGTLGHVRALSGYVRTADGEKLGFSIIANHFVAPTASVDAVVDVALERLAGFGRFGRD
jgi:serine-type D-Ala-D-Ala carboxypeptidase/endopeptidase (penicillin-binding protein 4)